MVGALILKRLIPLPRVPKLRNVLLFVFAAAIGSAASAVVGAFGITHAFNALYAREVQLWWAGNWLGSLAVAPVIMGWVVRWREPEHSVPLTSAPEMIVIALAMLASTTWVFSSPPGSIRSILDMPFLLDAFIVLAAFRLPPRWSATLLALNTAIAAYFVGRSLGPFAGDLSPFGRVGDAQLYLCMLCGINFLLSGLLLERRNALALLRKSDERYRNFIEHSSEAVWRVELTEPMSPALPVDEQIAWLRTHASVVESNLTYQSLSRRLGMTAADHDAWRPELPWTAAFIEHLGTAAQAGYVMDGLRFTVNLNDQHHTYITAFRGVIEQGHLVRIWGVARDVTQLVDLNERLRQNQERLRHYARELVGAEERARRATAVDLHDGIGQQLAGLSMLLDALATRFSPADRLRINEATSTVREVQGTVQRVIADLSPPGLYELGLEPALKWLSLYMRSKDNLQVELKVRVDDDAIGLELRILMFKVIRELLRNVVRHSGESTASVYVSCGENAVRAVVADGGVGFEWQPNLFEPREAGFGLWSIADRVHDAEGDITVDTAPGRGTRVTVSFPVSRVPTMGRKRQAQG